MRRFAPITLVGILVVRERAEEADDVSVPRLVRADGVAPVVACNDPHRAGRAGRVHGGLLSEDWEKLTRTEASTFEKIVPRRITRTVVGDIWGHLGTFGDKCPHMSPFNPNEF